MPKIQSVSQKIVDTDQVLSALVNTQPLRSISIDYDDDLQFHVADVIRVHNRKPDSELLAMLNGTPSISLSILKKLRDMTDTDLLNWLKNNS